MSDFDGRPRRRFMLPTDVVICSLGLVATLGPSSSINIGSAIPSWTLLMLPEFSDTRIFKLVVSSACMKGDKGNSVVVARPDNGKDLLELGKEPKRRGAEAEVDGDSSLGLCHWPGPFENAFLAAICRLYLNASEVLVNCPSSSCEFKGVLLRAMTNV